MTESLTQQLDQKSTDNRVDRLAQHCRNANNYAFSPMYSVFRTDNCGNYYLLYNGRSSNDCAEYAIAESGNPNAIGVEIRVNGKRINW